MPTTFIYGLRDPFTQEIRYVGKSNDPHKRLNRHILAAKTATSVHRLCWIKSLLNKGQRPIVVILEEVDINEWGDKENLWISKFDNLTNMIDGGKFCPMLVPEIARKAADSNKGKKLTLAARAKISERVKKQWEAGIRKRSFRKRTKEERSEKTEIMRKVWAVRSNKRRKEIGKSISESKNKPVIGFLKDGKIVFKFDSERLATQTLELTKDRIGKNCRSLQFNRSTKCYWRYA